MRGTLKDCLNDCLVALKRMTDQRDKWVKDWPGQVQVFSLFCWQFGLCSTSVLFSFLLPINKS